MANLEEKIEEDIDKEAAKIEAFEEPDEKTALLPKKDEKKKEKEKKKKDEKNKEKKPEDKKAASIGKIVTLISVDTEDLRQFLSFLYSWSLGVPLSAVLSFIGLWMLVGYATLAGVGTLLLIAPLTTYLTKRAFHITNEMMEIIDERVTKTNEILQGIRIVKYFAWESDFINAVESIRQRELKKLVLQRLTYMGFNMLTYGG
ncbi:Canalicular multispecific organic anion transporter 1, partial [Clydaea vesicula]